MISKKREAKEFVRSSVGQGQREGLRTIAGSRSLEWTGGVKNARPLVGKTDEGVDEAERGSDQSIQFVTKMVWVKKVVCFANNSDDEETKREKRKKKERKNTRWTECKFLFKTLRLVQVASATLLWLLSMSLHSVYPSLLLPILC
jgi:hypothetical protein